MTKLLIVLTSVSAGLTACKSKEGEWIETPLYTTRTSTHLELDKNAWDKYRSSTHEFMVNATEGLQKYLIATAKAFSIDPKEVSSLAEGPDERERAKISVYTSNLREVLKELKATATDRHDALKHFEAKVSEARGLCDATKSWFCHSANPEFNTTCESQRKSDTCATASLLRKDIELLEGNVKHYEEVIRALEERAQRTDDRDGTNPRPAKTFEA